MMSKYLRTSTVAMNFEVHCAKYPFTRKRLSSGVYYRKLRQCQATN